MNDKEVKDLVEKLDAALGKHNLTFDEYILYLALHRYENHNPEHLKSLEEKGLIKDKKVVDYSKIGDIDKTFMEFLTPEHHEGESNIGYYMRLLSIMNSNHPGGRAF